MSRCICRYIPQEGLRAFTYISPETTPYSKRPYQDIFFGLSGSPILITKHIIWVKSAPLKEARRPAGRRDHASPMSCDILKKWCLHLVRRERILGHTYVDVCISYRGQLVGGAIFTNRAGEMIAVWAMDIHISTCYIRQSGPNVKVSRLITH